MKGERAILLDVFFCPNEWLFAWLLHALIHDIMRTSHDVIHQTCLVAIKHCFTWFFLSSFHMPWSHGVTFLGTSAPLMIVIVMLFFQILLTVHKSIVRSTLERVFEDRVEMKTTLMNSWETLFCKRGKRLPRQRGGSKLDNGMVLLETQHGNHLGQGYIVSGLHRFCLILLTLGWTC